MMEIITNVGTFGNFKDILTHMRIEKLDTIEIISLKAWLGTSFKELTGLYSYDEIQQVITMEL